MRVVNSKKMRLRTEVERKSLSAIQIFPKAPDVAVYEMKLIISAAWLS
jgi:hypothetical protein